MAVHMHRQVHSAAYLYCSLVRHDQVRMNNYSTFVIYRSVLPELQRIMYSALLLPYTITYNLFAIAPI